MSERIGRFEDRQREAFLFGPVQGERLTGMPWKEREWPPPTGTNQSASAASFLERTESRAARTGPRARHVSDQTKQP